MQGAKWKKRRSAMLPHPLRGSSLTREPRETFAKRLLFGRPYGLLAISNSIVPPSAIKSCEKVLEGSIAVPLIFTDLT